MIRKNLPQIGIMLCEYLSESILEDINENLRHKNLDIKTKKIPNSELYASLEWAIPTLIAIGIFKPYFQSFLKEMGKDHYITLKHWMSKTSNNTRTIRVERTTAHQSINKIQSSDTQSKVFSIESIIHEDVIIKFLFDERYKSDIWDKAIDNALFLLEESFNSPLENFLLSEIKKNNLSTMIFAKIKNEKGEWEFTDFRTISKELMNN